MFRPADTATELEQIEIKLLLEGIFRRYGYDFRDYAAASNRRRVLSRVVAEGVSSISELLGRVLRDPACMDRLLLTLTVHVTSMFRDPTFYVSFREKVVPLLRTYPFARVWLAGCSSGEEAYSMSILLKEEGVDERCRIYATDLSEAITQLAIQGSYPLSAMKDYTANYQAAGGKQEFNHYYRASQDRAVFDPSLRENIVFAQHNLVTDGSFNEFNVILCRNVMIYFNKTLQDRVYGLFHQSLARFGVLALGRKESLRFSPHETGYEVVDEAERLYRKSA